MLAALDAAQAVGGDIRGCQSAAILVVSGKRSAMPWTEKKLDLRVDDSPAPLTELRRLVTLARAYDRMNQGDLAVEHNDMTAAAEHYAAASRLVPDAAEMTYWQGVAFASRGDFERATPLLKRAFEADPAWIELTRRLPAAGLLPDAATAEKAIEAAR
jgi:predicted Zn-dependent protease